MINITLSSHCRRWPQHDFSITCWFWAYPSTLALCGLEGVCYCVLEGVFYCRKQYWGRLRGRWAFYNWTTDADFIIHLSWTRSVKFIYLELCPPPRALIIYHVTSLLSSMYQFIPRVENKFKFPVNRFWPSHFCPHATNQGMFMDSQENMEFICLYLVYLYLKPLLNPRWN